VDVIVKPKVAASRRLGGLPIDGKTAALLCSRAYTSTLLVQNISGGRRARPR